MAVRKFGSFISQVTSPKQEVVISASYRTPIGRAKKGSFKDTPTAGILCPLMQGMLDRTKIDPTIVEDICIGNVLEAGSSNLTSRVAQLMTDIPDTAAFYTVNRMCSSGITAIASVANQIKAGSIDVGIGGGVESMTMTDMMKMVDPGTMWKPIFQHKTAMAALLPMGITSENVAEKFGIPRLTHDQMAEASHARALAAQAAGKFDSEIIPIETEVKDEEGKSHKITLSKDEGPREGTTVEKLSGLKAVFKSDGSTTAGNSSQMSDGAGIALLASREAAEKHNLPVLARFVDFIVVGCDPSIMGIGPAVAIPALLKKTGLSLDDIGVFELNEAFASQATYCVEKLGLDMNKVNPNGGAIALGHPLGATGAIQLAKLIPELQRRNERFGIISMCIGTGMGAAALIEIPL